MLNLLEIQHEATWKYFAAVVCSIHTNKLRSYGSKLVGKRWPKCREHSPKLGAQLPRNNFCRPGECAWESEGVQLSTVWCTGGGVLLYAKPLKYLDWDKVVITWTRFRMG